MLSNFRLVSLVGLTTLSFAVNATTYVGLDLKARAMKGRSAANYNMRQVLKKSFNSAEIYASYRGDNNVGLNLGFEKSSNANKNHTFVNNELFLGSTQSGGNRSFARAKIKALHLDVVGFYDIAPKWDAFGQLGVALMQVSIKGYTVAGSILTNFSDSRTYRLIPRVGLGVQYFPTKHLGFRGLVNWEATNIYRVYMTNNAGLRMSVKPYKQSGSVALGIIGRF